MNATLPGYQIVFAQPPPKKVKPKESFSWVLKLPSEEFPSEDLLQSQEFPVPQSARSISIHSLEHMEEGPARSPCAEQALAPHFPMSACLLEATMLADFEDADESQLPEAELLEDEELAEEAVFQAAPPRPRPLRMPFPVKPKPRVVRVAPEFVSNTHEYSGPLLGEVRCFHGMTLGELANVTRVAQHHLQNIESEQYDSLPATVYLRGYLKSVARELGLDVQLVSQSYLDRMQQARS